MNQRMKIIYDRETDTLTITLRDERIRESDEILSASKVVAQPKSVAHQLQ